MTRTAMILAAGLGTRLRPLTDTMPKALVPYHGTPMIQGLMLKLKNAGFTRVVVNLHHFADMLEDFVRSHDGFGLDEVLFSDERDLLLDTGGGIRHAYLSGLFGDGPVLVHNVDIISNIGLRQFYDKAHDSTETVAGLLVSKRDSSRHLLSDVTGRLRGWEYPAKTLYKGTGPASRVAADTPEKAGLDSGLQAYAFSGIHYLTPAALRLMKAWPDRFSIIDFYLEIADRNNVHCLEAPDGTVITDIGKPDQLRGLSVDLDSPVR